MNTQRIKNSLTPSFELSVSERLQLNTLHQENDILRKLKAELSAQNRRDNYENAAIIRKQAKHIEKLQQEVNALKVANSGVASETISNDKTIARLPIKTLRYKPTWQGESLFNRTG